MHCRRVTAAVAVVKIEEKEKDGAKQMQIKSLDIKATDVPGKQTVPRAELWAALQAKHAIGEGQSATIWSDSAYVVRGGQAYDPEQLHSSYNGDLWQQWDFTNQDAKVGIDKVRAHGEHQVLAGMLDIELYLHNAWADAAADAAADILADVIEQEAEEKWAAVAYLVGRRLAVVEAEV